MVVAPVARTLEGASPNAPASVPCGLLLGPVVASRDRQSLRDQNRAEIVASDRAPGQEAFVAVLVLRMAFDRAGGEEAGHAIASGMATGPAPAVGTCAILGEFGRIEAQEPNALAAQAETIAIAGPCSSGDGWRWRVQASGQKGNGYQDDTCQHGPEAT